MNNWFKVVLMKDIDLKFGGNPIKAGKECYVKLDENRSESFLVVETSERRINRVNSIKEAIETFQYLKSGDKFIIGDKNKLDELYMREWNSQMH